MASWFRLADNCPRCKLNTNREEGDYFLGAYVIMLIAIELLFAFLFGYSFSLILREDTSSARAQYLRRLVGLLVLGALHAHA